MQPERHCGLQIDDHLDFGDLLNRQVGWFLALEDATKMGTIRSPWHYDARAYHTLESENTRRPAILRYAWLAAVIPMSQGGPVILR
jgi:hypothetical protein